MISLLRRDGDAVGPSQAILCLDVDVGLLAGGAFPGEGAVVGDLDLGGALGEGCLARESDPWPQDRARVEAKQELAAGVEPLAFRF